MAFTERQQLVRSVLEEVLITEQRVELKFKIPLPSTPKEGRSRPSRLATDCVPHVKVGHFVRFDPAEIVHWLDNTVSLTKPEAEL